MHGRDRIRYCPYVKRTVAAVAWRIEAVVHTPINRCVGLLHLVQDLVAGSLIIYQYLL